MNFKASQCLNTDDPDPVYAPFDRSTRDIRSLCQRAETICRICDDDADGCHRSPGDLNQAFENLDHALGLPRGYVLAVIRDACRLTDGQ